VIKRFKELQKEALHLIENSFLSKKMLVNYEHILNSRFEIINKEN